MLPSEAPRIAAALQRRIDHARGRFPPAAAAAQLQCAAGIGTLAPAPAAAAAAADRACHAFRAMLSPVRWLQACEEFVDVRLAPPCPRCPPRDIASPPRPRPAAVWDDLWPPPVAMHAGDPGEQVPWRFPDGHNMPQNSYPLQHMISPRQQGAHADLRGSSACGMHEQHVHGAPELSPAEHSMRSAGHARCLRCLLTPHFLAVLRCQVAEVRAYPPRCIHTPSATGNMLLPVLRLEVAIPGH